MLNIQLSLEELQFVVNTIAEKPFVEVEGLIQNIRQQVDAQMKEQNETGNV